MHENLSVIVNISILFSKLIIHILMNEKIYTSTWVLMTESLIHLKSNVFVNTCTQTLKDK